MSAFARPSGRRRFSAIRPFALIPFFLLLFSAPVAMSQSGAQNLIGTAQASFERGDYRAAVSRIDQAHAEGLLKTHPTVQFRALMLQADAYRMLGLNAQALNSLRRILTAKETLLADAASRITFYNRLGAAHQQAGEFALAAQLINDAVETATALDRPDLLSPSLNSLGNLNVAQDNIDAAISAYTASVREARRSNQPSLIATASVNLSRALIGNGTLQRVRGSLTLANQQSALMSGSAAQVENFLAIAELYIRAQKIEGEEIARRAEVLDILTAAFPLPLFSATHLEGQEIAWRTAAHEVLSTALTLAKKLNNDRFASYALGYLGQLYEYEARYAEALTLTRKAQFLAQSTNAGEALYLWEWQTARLLAQLGKTEDAIAAYRRAISALSGIRASLLTGTAGKFRELVGPMYFEMADLLLTRTATLKDKAVIRQNLLEVRNTLEQLKASEIVDYFDNNCVVLDQGKAALDRLASTAAILYPVILADRIELLVSFPDEMMQFSVPVSAKQLTAEIRKFRLDIESTSNRESYLQGARRLYQWLVEPFEAELVKNNIDTLVVVPDGALRTIPMSALYDGDRFLVQKYALATTPGLSLTNPQPIKKRGALVLVNGITEAVQGFSALPSVAGELKNIGELYSATTNVDKSFLLNSVEQSMSAGPYSIVHIATHGQFNSDHRKSFLLAYDDKLTMDRLENSIGLRRYQEDAVELLVLSACQTAAGDDRAALGMAGIALKAGARSALATLWFINDASTSELMTDFYRNLKVENITKAQALQRAQVKMISKKGFEHPAYWAPFLLIGNWL